MARQHSYSGDYRDMPVSVLRALEVDRAFYADALCKTDRNTPKLAWTADSGTTPRYKIGNQRYSGDKLNEMALLVCDHCPVQWQCAEAAIDAGEAGGVWADRLDNLHYLQARRLTGWRDVLHMAQSTGVSVQRTIRMVRGGLT